MYNNTTKAMDTNLTTAQYIVQRTPFDRKERIFTAESFEVLIRKYCYVKMLG